MDHTTLNKTLSTIHTFKDYEKLKKNIEEEWAKVKSLKELENLAWGSSR